MAIEEEVEKTYYKLNPGRSTVFYDSSQLPPNKIVGDQVVALLETEKVANAVTYKHIVPAKAAEVKAYLKKQEEAAAAAPAISLPDVQAAASQVVADAETHASTIKQEAEQHKATTQAAADKILEDANAAAKKTIDEAKQKASALTATAKQDAEKLLKDAKDKAAAEASK